MTICIVIQARMSSSRLPGKVMLPLAGRPLLAIMLERVAAIRTPAKIVVATTTDGCDDVIAELCMELGVTCFRGHPTDLLDRHYRVGRLTDADAVVKIPSDCPMIDPAIIDRVLRFYLSGPERWDYVSNLHPASYPDGNDVEVIPMRTLATAWEEAEQEFEREHTTPFIWERPERFRCGNVRWETGRDLSMSHRWTIDYPEDHAFLSAVFDELYTPARPAFSMEDVLRLLAASPAISQINEHLAGLNWYRHHLSSLRTIPPTATRI